MAVVNDRPRTGAHVDHVPVTLIVRPAAVGHRTHIGRALDQTLGKKEPQGQVRVLVTIFGRQAPVELEFWQIAKAEDA